MSAPHPSTAAPLGATVTDGGVNFSLYSRDATAVELLLFDRPDDVHPARVIEIRPDHRTFNYWHTFVAGLGAGQLYGYRAHGRFEPGEGLRFDAQKLLLDPYARAVVVPKSYGRQAARHLGDTTATAMKGVVVDPSTYDWEGDEPLHHSAARTIIYEMHVRGFTRHPNSGVAEHLRGTYAGLIEKIPYLVDLGITAVELLPIFHFDHQACPPGLTNYWGYQPVAFFAPHARFSSRRDPLGPPDEFRDMVKALHRAGIEVILDVVFNHTAEGDHTGPTLSLRGIDNRTYYHLKRDDRSRYADYTGCGNTVNADNPVVRRLVLDCLRYWVREMHVDGFRFDLASALARDADGNVLTNPALMWDIESDPVLAGTKLIAEAWDAAGAYQVGHFVGDRWQEWNGAFRDDARAFFRAERGSAARFADRLVGSPEIFGHEGREPEQSINFVTCHDGFTLNDLVSYERKHNERNGEDNRDGHDDNKSWNCGEEGPTDDPAVEKLRERQIKNFLAVTTVSLGVPMILMGDEVRRTQQGNNNAYCHDNELTWFDWSLLDRHAGLLRFTRLLIARRALRSDEHERLRQPLGEILRVARKTWHGPRLHEPDWSADSHRFALTAELREESLVAHLMLNPRWDACTFELPCASETSRPIRWRRWIDTALDSPDDIVPWNDAPTVPGWAYRAQERSVVVLIAEVDREGDTVRG